MAILEIHLMHLVATGAVDDAGNASPDRAFQQSLVSLVLMVRRDAGLHAFQERDRGRRYMVVYPGSHFLLLLQ